MTPAFSGHHSPLYQRGFISGLTAFVLMTLLLVMALLVDTGRLFLEKRQLQKVADMAAMEASARLPRGYCAGAPALAQTLALESAAVHGFVPDAQRALSLRCVTLASQDGMRQVSPIPHAAVEVTVSRSTPASLVLRGGALVSGGLGENVTLTARATAQRSDAVAAFTVGSQLLRLERERPVGRFLRAAGVDTTHLTTLNASGVASTYVSPLGLFKALGIETSIMELSRMTSLELIALTDQRLASLTLAQLIDAMARNVDDESLRASLRAFGRAIAANPRLGQVKLKLLGSDATGLIELKRDAVNSTRAVLESRVNLAELLAVALLTGTREQTIALESHGLFGLEVAARMVSAPVIAIGPAGSQVPGGQLRLDVKLDTAGLAPLGPFSGLLGVRVNFPITLDLGSAQAELTRLQCQFDTPTADIAVTTSTLEACVGNLAAPGAAPGPQSCAARLENTEFLRLFSQPMLAGRSHINGLRHQALLPDMRATEKRTIQPDALALGTKVNHLVGDLLDILAGFFRPPQRQEGPFSVGDKSQDVLLQQLATQYLEATKDSSGFYHIEDVLSLTLRGISSSIVSGPAQIPILTNDFVVVGAPLGPILCPLGICPQLRFAEAFRNYANYRPGVLGTVAIPILGSPYQACGWTRNSRTNWNACLRNNLFQLLRAKSNPPLEMINVRDALIVADAANTTGVCTGSVCHVLGPLLRSVKPSLTGVGTLVSTQLPGALGVTLGQTEVHLHSTNCGVPSIAY
ncbi:pilus assembly protein TadG-related protein [Vreelandella sp. EE27]